MECGRPKKVSEEIALRKEEPPSAAGFPAATCASVGKEASEIPSAKISTSGVGAKFGKPG